MRTGPSSLEGVFVNLAVLHDQAQIALRVGQEIQVHRRVAIGHQQVGPGAGNNAPNLLRIGVALAAKRQLIVTGSSDYHGVYGKPNRLGENTTAPEMLERILAAATGCAPIF